MGRGHPPVPVMVAFLADVVNAFQTPFGALDPAHIPHIEREPVIALAALNGHRRARKGSIGHVAVREARIIKRDGAVSSNSCLGVIEAGSAPESGVGGVPVAGLAVGHRHKGALRHVVDVESVLAN